jgi:hypothetical protein
VVEHGAESHRQRPPAGELQLVCRRRQVIAAQGERNATQIPQRPLDATDERLERLGKRNARPQPLAERQHELEQEMREGPASDGNAQLFAVREVDRRLAPHDVFLLEEHLLLRAVDRAPVAHASLQRPHLPGLELAGLLLLEQLDQGLGLEHALGIRDEQRQDQRGPHRGERIGPCAPVALLLRR